MRSMVCCQLIDLWYRMRALSWYSSHCWAVQVLCIVSAQGGGHCSIKHMVKMAVQSAKGRCTATAIAHSLLNRSQQILISQWNVWTLLTYQIYHKLTKIFGQFFMSHGNEGSKCSMYFQHSSETVNWYVMVPAFQIFIISYDLGVWFDEGSTPMKISYGMLHHSSIKIHLLCSTFWRAVLGINYLIFDLKYIWLMTLIVQNSILSLLFLALLIVIFDLNTETSLCQIYKWLVKNVVDINVKCIIIVVRKIILYYNCYLNWGSNGKDWLCIYLRRKEETKYYFK